MHRSDLATIPVSRKKEGSQRVVYVAKRRGLHRMKEIIEYLMSLNIFRRDSLTVEVFGNKLVLVA